MTSLPDPSSPRPAPRDAPSPGGASSVRSEAFARTQASPEFRALRLRYRRFVFPTTAGALAFYFLYVLLAAYAPGFMAGKVVGNLNVGLVFGLLQFVMVFGITALYIRYARRVLDPMAEAIRSDLEQGALR